MSIWGGKKTIRLHIFLLRDKNKHYVYCSVWRPPAQTSGFPCHGAGPRGGPWGLGLGAGPRGGGWSWGREASVRGQRQGPAPGASARGKRQGQAPGASARGQRQGSALGATAEALQNNSLELGKNPNGCTIFGEKSPTINDRRIAEVGATQTGSGPTAGTEPRSRCPRARPHGGRHQAQYGPVRTHSHKVHRHRLSCDPPPSTPLLGPQQLSRNSL